MKRHKYQAWTVKVHGKDTGTAFKTEASARSYANSREGATVHSSTEFGDCAKVTSKDPNKFCAACRHKVPLVDM